MLKIFKELPTNKEIPKILEYCLALGNYLNGTTPRGGAWGFKFENIDKVSIYFKSQLSDVKKLDNKTTLLMYAIK